MPKRDPQTVVELMREVGRIMEDEGGGRFRFRVMSEREELKRLEDFVADPMFPVQPQEWFFFQAVYADGKVTRTTNTRYLNLSRDQMVDKDYMAKRTAREIADEYMAKLGGGKPRLIQ